MLAGVQVTAVTESGLADLGVTGEDGALCVDKAEIATLGPYVIILCKESFFCGAFRTDEKVLGHAFLDFDEQFIALSRFVISD